MEAPNPVARVRANLWLAVGIAVAALLIVAWLAWSIYVASDRGVNEGLGVLIAVPALVIAVAIASLPFIGIYLLIRRLGSGGGREPSEAVEKPASDEKPSDDPKDEEKPEDEETGDDEDESEDDDEDDSGEEEEESDQGDTDEEPEPEPETAAS